MEVLVLSVGILSLEKAIQIFDGAVVASSIFFCKQQVDVARTDLGRDPNGIDVTSHAIIFRFRGRT